MAEKSVAKKTRRGPRALAVELPKSVVTVYAGARIADALQEITGDMTLYHGVRLAQVLEAVYEQGRTDGRRQVFEEFDKEFDKLRQRPELKHRNPGRPKKKVIAKKPAAKKSTAKRKGAAKKRTTKRRRRRS